MGKGDCTSLGSKEKGAYERFAEEDHWKETRGEELMIATSWFHRTYQRSWRNRTQEGNALCEWDGEFREGGIV